MAGPFSLNVINTYGYQDNKYDPESKGGQVSFFTLNQGERRSVPFELEEEFRISGRIVDQNGNELADDKVGFAMAWARKKDGDGYEMVGRASRPGAFSFGDLDGRPILLMVADFQADDRDAPYPTRYYPGTFDRNKATPITFAGNRHVEDLEIQMQLKGGVVLQGQVTDDRGTPIPNAFITVYRGDMMFDLNCTYTDEQGRYEIQGLAPGRFQVDVDCAQADWVRQRKLAEVSKETGTQALDIQMEPGLRISGRFVDESGQPWELAQSHGSAYTETPHTHTTNCSSGTATSTVKSVSFSLTGFHNKHRSTSVRSDHGSFVPGDGSYGSAQMFFPTKTSFVIEGAAPGQTTIYFKPKKEGQTVKAILYDGKDILESGLPAEAGQDIEDVVIVIGEDS